MDDRVGACGMPHHVLRGDGSSLDRTRRDGPTAGTHVLGGGPRRAPPHGRGVARRGLEPPDDPGVRGLRRAGAGRGRPRRPHGTGHDPGVRRAGDRDAPLLPGHRPRRCALLRAAEGRTARAHGRRGKGRGPARGRRAAVAPGSRAHGARGGAGELAAHAPLLLPLRRTHRHRRRGPHPPLPRLPDRALPADRPRGDHAGHRRPGPRAARPPAALARGPLLDARRLRRTRRVHRAGGAPRGRGGGRGHRRRRRQLRGEPAVALPLQPDAGLQRPRGLLHDHRGRRGDPRGPLVLPRGPAGGLRLGRGAAAVRHLDRRPADRELVRRPAAASVTAAGLPRRYVPRRSVRRRAPA
ncbi:hypothetical protein SBRY_10722 [Actinacidiphila bryophytorum]|uniref:Uncharacterized protein n=1 Tax=Actinacidiphila bryophytorum TaxID=1436133 RepID=A0A9W4E0X4_9ACTN|nr:hypothetical protein SBRY_10722 [Actinacidiphila bryophytorum]